ncbi:nucleotide-binding protein [Herbaspirillum huttiense F1]|uniref:nucleotide-binding protein n=1 Tax=Herbaspirillum huttiense TaxID=863372 RepID=UPI0028873A7C|nr:nucleotide-binding protein [Herbaspirillum huttiense]MDT0354767.1 nucleotide-binding protein [Herbaspirillum huttiense F1]
MKPKVFIGSSREGMNIANAIHSNMTYEAECTVWKDGVFQLSQSTLSDLIRVLRDSDFGIFVFSPDDVAIMRGNTNHVVRDNVLFELGLFIGRLGSDRCFFLIPDSANDLRLPSDLAGITPGRYEGSRSDGNWMAALNPVCTQIKYQIERLKSFQDAVPSEQDIPPVLVSKAVGVKVEVGETDIALTESNQDRLYIEGAGKGFVIKGETKPHKELLKSFGASWNPALQGWVVSPKKKLEFEQQHSNLLR